MGSKRAPGSARVEEQVVVAWKRYADRKAQGLNRVLDGACYLESRPCPFDARPDFDTRFAQDCVHCSRVQEAAERRGALPEGPPGVVPTLPLLFHLLEEEAQAVRLEHEDGLEDEAERYRSAGFLFRSIPLMHVALTHERIGRLLLSAIGGAFNEEVDSMLLFRIVSDGTMLELAGSFRCADRVDPDAPMRRPPDLDAFESEGGFDGEVFAPLREERMAIEPDQDLLADAIFDGRASMILSPQRELRLPERVADAIPDGPLAILPVFGREKVLGVLLVSQAAGYSGWTGDQIELLGAIAAQAGIALEGNTVLDVVRRRGTTVRSAIEFSRIAAQPSRPDVRAEQALKALIQSTQAAGGVAWVRAEDGSLDLAHVHAVDPAATQDLGNLGSWLVQWFEADSKPIVAERLSEDPRFSGFMPEDWRCLLAAPIQVQGRVSGTLLVFNKAGGTQDDPLTFDSEDARVADLMTSIAALADTRFTQEETLRVKDRRLNEVEAQLRHAEKLAVVGERGVQVAQDVRNPVAAITGFAKRVLKSLPAKDPNREYLEIILRETERLERVLSEQVALAQMTKPRLKLENLNALVQDVLQSQAEDLVRRRVRLLKRLSPDVPSLLLDNEKMRQVLVNVLSYALHSVPSGGRVRVETRAAQGAVQTEIAHDGPKVAGEVLDRLFVPFSTSRRYGAGVGLAMAYQIVREHGGEIRARSEGDWSSIVTIYLPTRENDDRRRKPDRREPRTDRRRRLA
jgi:signal transduction histidine kinase